MVSYEFALKLYNELSADQQKQLPEFTPEAWKQMWETFQTTKLPELTKKSIGGALPFAVAASATGVVTCTAWVFTTIVAISAVLDRQNEEQYYNLENYMDWQTNKCSNPNYCRARYNTCLSNYINPAPVNPYCDFTGATSGSLKYLIQFGWAGNQNEFFGSLFNHPFSYTFATAVGMCASAALTTALTASRAVVGGSTKRRVKRTRNKKMKRSRRH